MGTELLDSTWRMILETTLSAFQYLGNLATTFFTTPLSAYLNTAANVFLPDAIKNLPLAAVVFGAGLAFVVTYQIIKWVIDLF